MSWGTSSYTHVRSCLVPTLVELAATQKPSASSETWVLALVTIIPFASYVAIKSDVDMHIPALTSMALSFCAAIVFTGTTGRFCWPHLAFWLIVCSIMAFFFDEMREITKAADATPSMLNGNQLVTPCARLTQAVATGCFAGSVLWACFEILLPPGPSSSVTKAAVSMLFVFLSLRTDGGSLVPERHSSSKELREWALNGIQHLGPVLER
jgi:hypothetical protein